MYSKAKLAGHPLHPMLVAFPVAFYTATLLCFLVHAATDSPFWFRVGWYANAAGVATALLAAVPGFIDWAFGVPAGTPAKKTGLAHMLLHVGALSLFAVNLFMTRADMRAPVPGADGSAWILPLAGVILTVAGGFLGWKMVQTHHVGVDLTPEQERLEPRPIRPPGEAGRTEQRPSFPH